MNHFKAFMLGVGFSFGIYYLTKKDDTGKSLLDELLDHPREFMDKAKDYALDQAIRKVEEKIG